MVGFADTISKVLKYPMKMKYFGLSETKLFHFYGIFENGGGGGGLSEPHEPPLDPPLVCYSLKGLADQNFKTLFVLSIYECVLILQSSDEIPRFATIHLNLHCLLMSHLLDARHPPTTTTTTTKTTTITATTRVCTESTYYPLVIGYVIVAKDNIVLIFVCV